MTNKSTPKPEALRALDDAIARLTELDACASSLYDGFGSKLLMATLKYARSQVEAIQELRRPRKPNPRA